MIESIKNLFDKIKEGFLRFAPVHIAIVSLAIVCIADNHCLYSISKGETLDLVCGIFGGALFGLFVTLFGEFKDWKRAKILILSSLATLFFGTLGTIFWLKIDATAWRHGTWLMLYWGVIISLLAASIAVLYRSVETSSLIARLFLNLLGSSGSAVIVFASQCLCLLAFSELVMKVDDLIYADVILAAWILIPPIGFLSFLPRKGMKDESSERAIAFLFWLLLPAALLLLVILYLYLGRIALEGAMPSGTLNWFGSIALALYAFFWLALRESPRQFFRVVVRWGWTLIMPVVAVQIVGIAIRFEAYGLSFVRAAGMVTLLFGIVALILAAFNRSPFALFVFIAISGLVFTISPLNIADLAIWNQETRLRGALERYGLLEGETLRKGQEVAISDEDAEIIIGAWKYLTDRDYHFNRRIRIWRKDKLVEGIKSGLNSEETLFKVLGIENRDPAAKYLDNQRHTSFRLKIGDEEMIPITSSAKLKMLRYHEVHVNKENGRWTLSIRSARMKREKFDVHEDVERLLAKADMKDDFDSFELKIRSDEAYLKLNEKRRLVFEVLRGSCCDGVPDDRIYLENIAIIVYP